MLNIIYLSHFLFPPHHFPSSFFFAQCWIGVRHLARALRMKIQALKTLKANTMYREAYRPVWAAHGCSHHMQIQMGWKTLPTLDRTFLNLSWKWPLKWAYVKVVRSKHHRSGEQKANDTKMREHEPLWELHIGSYKTSKLNRNQSIKRLVEKGRFYSPDYPMTWKHFS